MSLQGHRTFDMSTLSRVFLWIALNIKSSLIFRISSSEIPKERRWSKKSIAASSWLHPNTRRAPERLTEHVVQRFRKKYFLRRKIFLAEKNISCGKKYFLRKKIYFLRRKMYFLRKKYISCGEKIFLAEKNISCGKKFFLRKKIYFLRRKICFLRRKIYFLRKKYISCGEKYISCGEKYFLRKKNISCGKIFLYHVTNKLPYKSLANQILLKGMKISRCMWYSKNRYRVHSSKDEIRTNFHCSIFIYFETQSDVYSYVMLYTRIDLTYKPPI